MQKLTRRSALVGLTLLPTLARAADQLMVSTDEGDMALSRYAADGVARRPAANRFPPPAQTAQLQTSAQVLASARAILSSCPTDHYVVVSELMRALGRADLVIDAMFGTGFRGALEGDASIIARALQGQRVLAVDIPSGLASDINPHIRFFVFKDKPDMLELVKPSGEPPVGFLDPAIYAISKRIFCAPFQSTVLPSTGRFSRLEVSVMK